MNNAFVKVLGLVLFAAAFAVGGFVAHPFLNLKTPFEPTETPATPEKEVVTVTDPGETMKLNAANASIAQLTAERDALRAQLEAAEAATKTAEEKATKAIEEAKAAQVVIETPRMSPAERREQLKKEDPERYAEMEKRREQIRQQMQLAKENRDNFLSDIDMTLLTPEQQEIHLAYTEAIARQDELGEMMRAKFEAGEPFSEEEREAMFENRRNLRALQEQERTALLSAVGTSMGFNAEESADFANLIEEVYSATQGNGMRRIRGDMPPPQGGNGNPPPGPPPMM